MSPQEQSKTVPVYVCCLEGISPKAVVYDHAAASECLDYSVPPSDWYEPSNWNGCSEEQVCMAQVQHSSRGHFPPSSRHSAGP